MTVSSKQMTNIRKIKSAKSHNQALGEVSAVLSSMHLGETIANNENTGGNNPEGITRIDVEEYFAQQFLSLEDLYVPPAVLEEDGFNKDLLGAEANAQGTMYGENPTTIPPETASVQMSTFQHEVEHVASIPADQIPEEVLASMQPENIVSEAVTSTLPPEAPYMPETFEDKKGLEGWLDKLQASQNPVAKFLYNRIAAFQNRNVERLAAKNAQKIPEQRPEGVAKSTFEPVVAESNPLVRGIVTSMGKLFNFAKKKENIPTNALSTFNQPKNAFEQYVIHGAQNDNDSPANNGKPIVKNPVTHFGEDGQENDGVSQDDDMVL